MSLVQLKIVYTYYTRKRTTPLFISEDELRSDDLQSFKDRLMTEVPHLAKTCSPLQLTVLDDQLEIDLSAEYFQMQMKELLNKRKEIKLQAFTFESPGTQTAAPVEPRRKSLPRTEARPSRRALELSPLFNDSDSEEDIHEDSNAPEKEIYLSPVDRLIESKQSQIKTQQEKIAKKMAEIEELDESFTVKPFALDMSRSACSKCHLRSGHTRTNCQNKLCTSARLCGELKRHPEDKKKIKICTQI